MNIFRNISIRNKVTIISMATCIIVLLLILIAFTIIQLTISRQALVKNVGSLSEVISLNCTAALAFNDQKSAAETLTSLSAESEIVAAAIYNWEGKLFAQYSQGQSYSKTAPSAMKAPDTCPGKGFPQTLESLQIKYAFQRHHLELVNTVLLDGQLIGFVYLKSTLAPLYEHVRWFAFLAVLSVLPCLLIAYLFSSQFQRIISRPIMSLAQTMKIVSQEKNYAVQVTKHSEDELGVLIDGFNEMLAQIQKRDAALEQHREVLEQEVARRTAQIFQSYRELERTIDELNRTTHFLAQNEARLAYAQQVARLGYWEWEWHMEADNLVCSGEVCRLLGWKPVETGMKREDFLHLIHPHDQRLVREALDNSLPPGSTFGLDFRISGADGSERIMNLQGEVIIAQDGKLFKMTGTIQDISERKAAEKALIESEEKYRALMNDASEGILLADVAGNLLEANKKMLEMLDYSLDKLLELKLFQIIPEADAPKVQAAFKELLLHGAGSVDNTSLLRKDGKSIPIDITASLVRYAGKTVAQAILRDISERKKMEEERLTLSKLESLGLLAGGIAHDFNNVLTAIMGNISMAMLDHQKGQYNRERLNEAERACLRAQALARQLLTFAKGGAPVKELVSLEKLISESASFTCRGSKVKCEFSFSPDLWTAKADPGQVAQVFQNLVINAIQAMPTGGAIEIRGGNLVVGANSNLPLDPGNYVKISLQDEGMGIPKEYLSKIFDPYFTTKQTGSGLGLATSYSIVKNHQGHMGVESRLGGGTIFHVYLPAAGEQMIQTPQDDKEVLTGQGKILVMDDEELVRRLLQEMLSRLGFEGIFARNGEEALELFSAAQESGKPFAAVILDLTIPGGMGGKETIKNLLKIDPQIKAIVSSGYSNDQVMAEFTAYGFRDIIVKPYTISEVSKVLNAVIGKGNKE